MASAGSPPAVRTLLLIVHSRTGGSQAMAEAFVDGALCEPALRLRTLQATACRVEDMRSAAALVFVGPENLGALSGAMKELLDSSYYPLLDHMQGKRYAHLICAGSDGHGAARQLARILAGWRMVPLAQPLIAITGAQSREAIEAPKILSPTDRDRCVELGQILATGLALGVY